jgi:hypothetical protein
VERRGDVFGEEVADPAPAVSGSPSCVRVRSKAVDEDDARGLVLVDVLLKSPGDVNPLDPTGASMRAKLVRSDEAECTLGRLFGSQSRRDPLR